MTPFPNGSPVPKQNLYSTYEINTSYWLYTSDRIVYSPYEWLPVRLSPRTNDFSNEWLNLAYLPMQIRFLTDYLSFLRIVDLFPERISTLCTNEWPPFRTDDLFPNIISILRTRYILRTDCLHSTGLFIPRTNESSYDWLHVRMTPRTIDSSYEWLPVRMTPRTND